MILGYLDWADEGWNFQPITEEHYLRPLRCRPSAITDVVNNMPDSLIQMPNRGDIIIGHDPTLPVRGTHHEVSDLLMVFMLVEVVIKGAALHIVRWIKVYEGLRRPFSHTVL